MRMLIAATTLAIAGMAHADAPPAGAMPLSQILAVVEERENVVYFEEVDWDDDGYWEVEFHTESSRVSMKIDPMTGETRQ